VGDLPDAHFRDALKALEYAQHACELSGWQDARVGHAGAAYAVNGRYAEAAKWQAQALTLADPADERDFQSRLELYRAGRPYSEQAA